MLQELFLILVFVHIITSTLANLDLMKKLRQADSDKEHAFLMLMMLSDLIESSKAAE